MFGGEIPKGVQMMIAAALKQAAPQLAETIDGIGTVVREFKAQLDRIEARQIEIENILKGNDHVGERQQNHGIPGIGRIGQGE